MAIGLYTSSYEYKAFCAPLKFSGIQAQTIGLTNVKELLQMTEMTIVVLAKYQYVIYIGLYKLGIWEKYTVHMSLEDRRCGLYTKW